MDNFRRHTPRRQKPTFVDGFVPPSSSKSTSDITPSNQKRSRSYQSKTKRPQIGDFNRPEGFTARTPKSKSLNPDGRATGRRPKYQNAIDMELPGETSKKNAKPKSRRKVALKLFSSLLIISVLLSGYVFGKGYLRARQVFQGGGNGAAALNDEIDPSKLNGEGDGRINVLMLARGGAGHDGADLTDTILIASIDPIQKETGLLSIPRDLYVKSPYGSSKINAVFANAKQSGLAKGQSIQDAEKTGFEALEKKVSEVAGIPIHYHVMVDFAGFSQAIDQVGGVTIDVKEPLYDQVLAAENRGNPLLASAGIQNMNGKKALLYAQSRYGSARGDFDRNQRQREVLVALKDKVFTLGTFGNPIKIAQLMDTFGSHIQTNFSIDEIMQLYGLGKDINSSQITSVGLADEPQALVTTSNIGGQSVVVPKAGTYDYAAIQSFVRNTFKDGFLKKENPSVVVLNGTTKSGAATAKAEELKSYGYNVISVDDAPTKNYTSNVLVDMRGGEKKYTKRYLELRFKTSAIKKLPDGIQVEPEGTIPANADFVIIVGQN